MTDLSSSTRTADGDRHTTRGDRGASPWSRRQIGWLLGGSAWIVGAVVGAGADEGTARFTTSLAIWLIAQCLLLAGLVALHREAPAGRRRGGAIGFVMAGAGRVAFVAAEAVSLATGRLAEAIYPLGALLTAIGMVLLGTAIVRERRWTGRLRWAPLALGIYPFIFMFPLVAAGVSPDLTIGLWGLSAIAVGLQGRGRVQR